MVLSPHVQAWIMLGIGLVISLYITFNSNLRRQRIFGLMLFIIGLFIASIFLVGQSPPIM